MKLTILFVLFAAVAINAKATKPRPGRIVGGVAANIEDIPWQVSLQWFHPFYEEWRHFCGGSIIDFTTILTAAHCVYGDKPEEDRVLVGTALKVSGGQFYDVRKIINHPEYRRPGLYNDISVLKLKTNLVFSNKVMPIGLPPRGFEMAAGALLLNSGWGRLESGGESPITLQKVWLPYVPNDQCAIPYGEIIVPGKLCAGETGKDACQGDSGGPLVYKNFVVGVVSGGTGCGWEGYPGYFARTSEFLEFIAGAMIQ